jgi:rod shape-determining protein MreC
MGVRDTRRTRRVLVVLLAAALLLVAFGYEDASSPVLRGVRHVSGSVFGGAEHAVSSVAGFVTGSGSSGQVHQLQTQLAQLRAELSAAQLSKSDYRQLHQLLLLAGAGRYRIVPASVIAIGQGYQQTVTLDAGSDSGVHANQTVLNGQGLVGQVTSVTASTCTVLLADDSSSVVGVSLAPSGQLGYVTGLGSTANSSGLLQLQVFNSQAQLSLGEALVTSASVHDQPFVPGVPIGTIVKIINKAGSLTPTALVRPYADLTGLGVVGIVVVPPAHSPQFSVLPPLPHPLPAVTVTVTARPSAGPSSSPTPGG